MNCCAEWVTCEGCRFAFPSQKMVRRGNVVTCTSCVEPTHDCGGDGEFAWNGPVANCTDCGADVTRFIS
jgi:hypothetical protein